MCAFIDNDEYPENQISVDGDDHVDFGITIGMDGQCIFQVYSAVLI